MNTVTKQVLRMRSGSYWVCETVSEPGPVGDWTYSEIQRLWYRRVCQVPYRGSDLPGAEHAAKAAGLL